MGPLRIGIAGILISCLHSAEAADSALIFSHIFGGSGNESISAMAADPSGNLIAAGATSSYDFPVTNNSFNAATHFAASPDSGGAWRPFSNLPSGTPISLIADSSNPPVWYAGGTTDIFKSTDGGATWQSIGPRGFPKCDYVAPFCGVLSLAIEPAPLSTIYARTASAGILKTTDGGVTWTSANAPRNPNPPAYLVLDPFHPGHLFTNIGLSDYRSFDGGATWTQFTPPLLHPGNYCGTGTPQVAFDAMTPNLVYMVDHCDLFRSTDGGIYWNPVEAPFQLSYAPVTHPTKGGAVYVTTFTGLYGTTDGGATWTLLLSNERGIPPHIVAIDPRVAGTTIVTDAFRSVDGGATWTPLALGRAVRAIVFDPQSPGRVLAATDGGSSAFLARLDGSGNLLAATYFGGQGATSVSGIATDAAAGIYVTGTSTSPDFPAPPVAGANTFVAKFDAGLNLLYARFLDTGPTIVRGIAVDGAGAAAVAATVSNAPRQACAVVKFTPDGNGVQFSTRFGGSKFDFCSFVAEDADGNTVVAGTTQSLDFPLTGAGTQAASHGDSDVIVAKLDPAGNLVYSGYLGGKDRDSASAVAVDLSGNIYVAGTTASKDFPTTEGAYQTTLRAHCPYPSSSVITGFIGTITSYQMDDAFVTKLDPAGNLVFSTYLGGDCYDVAAGMAVDASGNVWIAGTTDSDPFPQVSPFQAGPANTLYTAFVSELDASGGSLLFSSYASVGGSPAIAVDANGAVYLGGRNATPQSPYGGSPAPPVVVTGQHALLAKIQPQASGALVIQSMGNAFSRRDGPVSPGQITRIAAAGIAPEQPVDLGLTPADPLPRALADTQVLFDGEAAPLISVAAGEVVAIVPYDLAGKPRTAVQVVFRGTISAPLLADVAADAGYRSLDGSGAGQAYARNPDGTLNSTGNPAPTGSLVTVYVTGVGLVDPSCPEGGIASSAATITQSFFAGLATVPGSVCGLFQATVRTPTYPTTFALPSFSSVTVTVK